MHVEKILIRADAFLADNRGVHCAAFGGEFYAKHSGNGWFCE
jgi:hypothetical protein